MNCSRSRSARACCRCITRSRSPAGDITALDPKAFPSGNAGMRAAVEKGRALGIRIGAHTLTNFINTNDPYVTPVPDPRLSRTGESTLSADLDADRDGHSGGLPGVLRQREGQLAAHRRHRPGTHPVSRGVERRAVDAAGLRTRGVRHRRPPPTAAGAAVGKLLDHPYKVVLSDASTCRTRSRGTWPRGSTRPASATWTSTATRAALGHGTGRLRHRALREGVLRRAGSPGAQRHEQLRAVLLAHQHLLQLGRARGTAASARACRSTACRTRRSSSATSSRTCSGGTG